VNLAEIVGTTRQSVGLYDMAHRGLIEVRGSERERWLDGMISRDVQALSKAESGAGCYATLLTNRGAIVADLHVARIGESFLLESLRSAVPHICETLERFIIADDVTLVDRSDDFSSLGLEGPLSGSLLDSVAGGTATSLEPDDWAEVTIADRDVLIAAFGWSGEIGFQLRMSPEARPAVEEALRIAARESEIEMADGNFEALEVLRVEAGIPVLGAELDEEVLPPEARLEHAISTTKGCYVGQEIVARLRSRGQVNHLLVGFRLEGRDIAAPGAKLTVDGRGSGEFTSVVRSPTLGSIALGYVRREHSTEGTRVDFEGGQARVVALPFVAIRAAD
jgi:folate-binding protein YgfZ